MSDVERIKALEGATESLARALEGLHKIVEGLEKRIESLEATRGLENTARGQHA